MANRELSYTQAIREALVQEMRRDPSVYLIGEDIGAYGGSVGVTEGLQAEFGAQRVREAPISEAAFVGAAVGSAITGMRPVVELMFSDFITVCYDQIVNQAAKLRYMMGGQVQVPVVIRASSGGGTGASSQHSQSLEALLCHIPGLKVVMPATPQDAKGLMTAAVRDNNCVLFLEPKRLYHTTGPVGEEEYTLPLGEADLKRDGEDLTFIAWGSMVPVCLTAANQLQTQGVSAQVLDLRTLSPLDTQMILACVKKTGRAVIAHEAVTFGGFGGEIAALIAEQAFFDLKAPVRRVGALFSPLPSSKVLEDTVLPGLQQLLAAANSLLPKQAAQ
jgi:Pyruvate/2-oxoglutarate dehydrogenase complex, dehydrogenase (E1) component, eukaryotic type, beta subunit